jgi:hypothetical protein
MDYNIYFHHNKKKKLVLCRCRLGEGLGQVQINHMLDIQATQLPNNMEFF